MAGSSLLTRSGFGYGPGYGSGYGSGSGHGHGYGYGSGHGYGYGYGPGFGYGSGHGDGYGDGYGHGHGDGYGDGDPIGACGDHTATIHPTWGMLRIGCEVHALEDWIENAEEIDAKHGDGIADQTRALALSLAQQGGE